MHVSTRDVGGERRKGNTKEQRNTIHVAESTIKGKGVEETFQFGLK